MWLDFAIALILTALLFTAAWGLKGRLLTPIKTGSNTEITVFVRINGTEPCLEQTLKGLAWMRENGTLDADVKIVLSESDEATRLFAEAFARNNKSVTVCDAGEDTWKIMRNSTE